MRIEDQVCSLEHAKKLKELGVKQDSLFCYTNIHDSVIYLPSRNKNGSMKPVECIAAFTVSELGQMFNIKIFSKNFRISVHKIENSWEYVFFDLNDRSDTLMYRAGSHKEIESRAEMLIYLLENDIVKLQDVNNE